MCGVLFFLGCCCVLLCKSILNVIFESAVNKQRNPLPTKIATIHDRCNVWNASQHCFRFEQQATVTIFSCHDDRDRRLMMPVRVWLVFQSLLRARGTHIEINSIGKFFQRVFVRVLRVCTLGVMWQSFVYAFLMEITFWFSKQNVIYLFIYQSNG